MQISDLNNRIKNFSINNPIKLSCLTNIPDFSNFSHYIRVINTLDEPLYFLTNHIVSYEFATALKEIYKYDFNEENSKTEYYEWSKLRKIYPRLKQNGTIKDKNIFDCVFTYQTDYYQNGKYVYSLVDNNEYIKENFIPNKTFDSSYISFTSYLTYAPSFAQLFYWLNETYGISFEIKQSPCNKEKFLICITDNETIKLFRNDVNDIEFDLSELNLSLLIKLEEYILNILNKK